MKNRKFLFQIFLLPIQVIFSAQSIYSQTTFQKTYNNGVPSSFDWGFAVQETLDSNFITSGSVPSNLKDYGLLKMNRYGAVLWGKAYGITGKSDVAYSAQQTADLGYIMAGTSYGKLFLVKTNATGALQWAMTYDSVVAIPLATPVPPISIHQTSDGGYIVGSSILSYGIQVVFMVKVNATGNLSWARKYQSTGFAMRGGSVRQTQDGGYILASTHSGNTGDICLIKTNAAGLITWSKTYGVPGDSDYPFSVKQTNDLGFIVSGFQGSSLASTNDMLLLKTDSVGNILWDKVWGDGTKYERATGVIEDMNNNIVVTGWYATGIMGTTYQTYLAKINSSGSFIWQRGYGVSNMEDRGQALYQSRVDGHYLIGGITFGKGHSLIKTNLMGVTGANCSAKETAVNLPQIIPTLISASVISLTDSLITPDIIVVDETGSTVVTNLSPTVDSCSAPSCSLTITNPTSICQGNSQAISATGGNGYSWSPASTLNSSTASVVVAQPTTTTTYIVSDTVCGSFATTTVTVNPTPLISLNYPNILCLGDTDIIAAGGGLNYLWNTGSTRASIVIGPTVRTVYSLTVEANNGCSANTSFTVNVASSPIASITGKDSICTGALDTIVVSGANTYLWNTGSTNNSMVVSPIINTVYSVTAAIGNCQDTSTFFVYVGLSPTAGVSSSMNTICAGDSVVLTASGGTSYNWSNGNTSGVISVAPTLPATYSFTTSIGSCTDTGSVNIFVNQIPVANAGSSDTVCAGSTIMLNGSGGNTYLWNTGNTNSSINITPTSYSTFTLVAYNGQCSDTAFVSIGINPLPVVDSGNDVSIRYGNTTILSASGGGAYSWTPSDNLSCSNCPSPTSSPAKTTTYYATITDANGCTSMDSVIVIVDLSCGFFIPNVFSPNGDVQNDVFKVMSNCITFLNLVIFDRWGEKIFETSDTEQGWDGTFKSKECDSDVYIFNVTADLANGESIVRYGNVTLIR